MPGVGRWTADPIEILQDCRIFRVGRVRARAPRTGESHSFYRIQSVDWVNIVPVTPEGEVVMVRQYRHGTEEITLEIPGGMVDPGESPADAAARELLEETGYRAETVAPLGSLRPNPALFDNRLHVFLARDARRVAEIANAGAEETDVARVPPPELRRMLREGAVDHALVVASLYRFVLDHQESGGVDPLEG